MALAVLILRIVLAAVFLLAALAKLASMRRTWARVRLFGIPDALARPVAVALPITELVIAVLLIPEVTARAGGVLAAVALLVFAAAIVRLLARGEAPDCNCFGLLHASRVGPDDAGTQPGPRGAGRGRRHRGPRGEPRHHAGGLDRGRRPRGDRRPWRWRAGATAPRRAGGWMRWASRRPIDVTGPVVRDKECA